MDKNMYTIDMLPTSITVRDSIYTMTYYLNIKTTSYGGWEIRYVSGRGSRKLNHGDESASSLSDCIKRCLKSLEALSTVNNIEFN